MAFLAVGAVAHAQGVVYRCGNEYTNIASAAEAKARGCKTVSGTNITVIEGTRVNSGGGVARSGGTASNPAASGSAPPAAASNAPRVAPDDQRARDSDARAILEGELRRTEARLADLRRDYNNGEPEKMGSEARNHQKYLDRVADMKANIARAEEDVAGIKRELGRLGSR